MREHMLSQMRAHLEALQGVLAALGTGDPGAAAKIAETRLGLEAPGAAACRPGHGDGGEGMEATMSAHMPEEMRAMGFAMHESASDFAAAASKAGENGDLRPALAALATMTQNCVACHSAFRLK
jgi:cytochrome c556